MLQISKFDSRPVNLNHFNVFPKRISKCWDFYWDIFVVLEVFFYYLYVFFLLRVLDSIFHFEVFIRVQQLAYIYLYWLILLENWVEHRVEHWLMDPDLFFVRVRNVGRCLIVNLSWVYVASLFKSVVKKTINKQGNGFFVNNRRLSCCEIHGVVFRNVRHALNVLKDIVQENMIIITHQVLIEPIYQAWNVVCHVW